MRRFPAAVLLVLILAAPSLLAQVTAKSAALSTAHPLATRAGLQVLQKGGSAADAAVAVAFTLAVVHPQSGNLGGGGFLVYYDASTRGIWTLDFRETAPRAAKRDMFEKTPATGALAGAIPGTVAGLGELHKKFGGKPWKELLAPALALAKEGPRDDAEIKADIAAAKHERNLDIPTPIPPVELTATLQRLADAGPNDFYKGEIASKLVAAVRNTGGIFGFRDLSEYAPVWRAPIKLSYGPYELYTVAPPSGGGLVIGETLNILGKDDLGKLGFQSVPALHLMLEAERRANIDRMQMVGDPAGARIPYRDLLSQKRGEQWRATIDKTRATATTSLTTPSDLRPQGEQTTHFTIADSSGNVVSLTTSLGGAFGSGVMLPGLGFFLNAAMTDFSAGVNALEPGRRPASSMSPVIVLRDNKPFLALGTRGGAGIAPTILQVFLNVVVHGKSLVDAVAAPRYHHEGLPDSVMYERSRAPQATIDAINALGHGVTARESIGDVQAILFENGRLVAVADSRRGGAAGGY